MLFQFYDFMAGLLEDSFFWEVNLTPVIILEEELIQY